MEFYLPVIAYCYKKNIESHIRVLLAASGLRGAAGSPRLHARAAHRRRARLPRVGHRRFCVSWSRFSPSMIPAAIFSLVDFVPRVGDSWRSDPSAIPGAAIFGRRFLGAASCRSTARRRPTWSTAARSSAPTALSPSSASAALPGRTPASSLSVWLASCHG
jgi:hypothetical protein